MCGPLDALSPACTRRTHDTRRREKKKGEKQRMEARLLNTLSLIGAGADKERFIARKKQLLHSKSCHFGTKARCALKSGRQVFSPPFTPTIDAICFPSLPQPPLLHEQDCPFAHSAPAPAPAPSQNNWQWGDGWYEILKTSHSHLQWCQFAFLNITRSHALRQGSRH